MSYDKFKKVLEGHGLRVLGCKSTEKDDDGFDKIKLSLKLDCKPREMEVEIFNVTGKLMGIEEVKSFTMDKVVSSNREIIITLLTELECEVCPKCNNKIYDNVPTKLMGSGKTVHRRCPRKKGVPKKVGHA